MNKQETIEKVKELMQDDQFKAKLSEVESFDEMATLFSNEGIPVTGADLEAAIDQQNGDELSEEDLNNVAGGIAISGLIAAGIIVFVAGSFIWGYVDGVKKKLKKCKIL